MSSALDRIRAGVARIRNASLLQKAEHAETALTEAIEWMQQAENEIAKLNGRIAKIEGKKNGE